MGSIADFEAALDRKSPPSMAQWRGIDLHNHSPISDDYLDRKPDVATRIAERIRSVGLSVVMFTDHNKLPTQAFVDEIAAKSGALVLRGVELNVFIDAWDKPASKVAKNLFFHLLVGFDPDGDQPPEYWLEHIHRSCKTEDRPSGNTTIRGITDSIDELYDILKDANAILIPAHLHSTPDAFRSRSVDDIYADPEFLRHARDHFTALEVRSPSTVQFFDGLHDETGRIHKTCVRSSDSHEPATIGTRYCYAQLQEISYRELKAALELPFRVAIDVPSEPSSYIAGVHVQGVFLKDFWLSLSPNCNVFIGVKGSGKTSVLECLRFALGVDIPSSSAESVSQHLDAILGAAGKVRLLLKRSDGTKVLLERARASQEFVLTFSDDRVVRVSQAEALQFPSYILGWHEIEQAATDPNIRRQYLDTIAGRDTIRNLDDAVRDLGHSMRQKHEDASHQYKLFRALNDRVCRLSELRDGLQQLSEADLVNLKEQYEQALKHKEAFENLPTKLIEIKQRLPERTAIMLSEIEKMAFDGPSPLSKSATEAHDRVLALFAAVEDIEGDLGEQIDGLHEDQVALKKEANELFDAFAAGYEIRLDELSPEQRKLLDAHRRVAEKTRQLPETILERDSKQNEVRKLLGDLVSLCDQIVAVIDRRTDLRRDRVSDMNKSLEPSGVQLDVIAQQPMANFQELTNKYSNAAKVVNELQSRSSERLHHLRLKKAYEDLLSDLVNGYRLIFEYTEFYEFLTLFEDDDLLIRLKVGKPGEEFSPIDQLSAGQRCTAIFPLLLGLEEGPLVLDQPEDNLDNRHIAGKIAPAMLRDKRRRQIILTSHNANLVVLSDAELIVSFEATGAEGHVNAIGFLATRESEITSHVLDILDGGEWALELRYRKYGRLE